MNANELRQIDFCNPDSIHYANSKHYIAQLEAMLRQQQAEIEAFKLQYYNTGYSLQLRDKDETIRQQQAEIEALKYEKSSGVYDPEPVAWFEQDPNMKSIWYQADKDAPNSIPLYTHPAKTQADIEYEADKAYWRTRTLTDEEIDAVGDEVSNLIDTYAGRREFARAILRKAQEK